MPPSSASLRCHLFPLLIILLLLCIFPPPVLSASRCASCGSTPVPYPLSTSPNCGDPLYKIQCNAGKLSFNSLNNTYPITSVSPNTQRLTIQNSPFIPNTCVTSDIISEGVELDQTLPFNITSSNTILYLNCSQLLLSSPLNCTSTSLCHTYINGSLNSNSGDGACASAPLCCTFRAGGSTTSYQIRVRNAGCRAYRSFVNLDATVPVSQWPQPGLELQWVSPLEPICTGQSGCQPNSVCGPDSSSNSGLRRCFCNSGFHWDAITGLCSQNVICQDPNGCKSHRTALIAGLTVGLGVSSILAILLTLFYRRYQGIKQAKELIRKEREEMLNSGGGKSAKVFTGKEIRKATNNFSRDRLLGIGGYGEVYKGTLNDGSVVAIKCAKLGNIKGTEQVLNEVRILCQVNHRSLVGLLGCCVELEQPLMVYEFVENGTLFDHLRGDRKRLTWSDRLEIARATAEGLAYLHFAAVPPIYHRDVKSSNILLDHKLKAKVSDFGLSRLAHTDLSHISTCAQGTLGYLDPEYYRNYQLTDKSDVYSFGVVLLELLTSQKAIDFNRPPDDVNLAVYVQRLVAEEKLVEGIDPYLMDGATKLEMETMKAIGFLAVGCLEEKRQNRPSMKEVEEEIEYIISVSNAKAID